MGYSRATDASAQFFMTNGVIATDNLKIHSSLMLLECKGTLDLTGNLDAHFTSQLLHDVPGLGLFFSVITVPVGKLCECKVTGTWDKPKVSLLYLNLPQRFFLDMLRPFHYMDIDKNRNNTQQQPSP
jgi:hypothetical protein